MLEGAAKDKAPILLYFVEEDIDPIEAGEQLHCAELAKMSEEGNFYFIMIEHNADRTPSLDDGCPVPTSKLLSANPSRDYGITKYPSYLVCDWYGNEYNRYAKIPAAKDVKANLEGIEKSMEAQDKKLAATMEVAKKALEEKDLKDFFKAAKANFKTGFVGLKGQEDTIALYRKVIDDARTEVETILEEKPADGEKRLKELQKTYRETELETEIKDALDIVKG